MKFLQTIGSVLVLSLIGIELYGADASATNDSASAIAAPALQSGVAEAKDAALEKSKKPIRVGLVERPPYIMKDALGAWSGITIDLWEEIAKNLGLKFEYVEAMQSELRAKLKSHEIDVMPIIAQGTEYLDTEKFTQAYIFSYGSASINTVSLLSSLDSIYKQLSTTGLISAIPVILATILVLSLILVLIEGGRKDTHLEGTLPQRFASALWLVAMCTISPGYGDSHRLSIIPKIISILWMLMGLIFISFFTGSVVSALTTANLQSSVVNISDLARYRCGVFAGTKTDRSLAKSGIPTRKFSTHESGYEALDKGQITAFCTDALTAKYFINNDYANQFKICILPDISLVYAIGMRVDDPLYESINREVIKAVNAPDWRSRVERYTGPMSF